jgi:hypothetical protein
MNINSIPGVIGRSLKKLHMLELTLLVSSKIAQSGLK